MARTVNLYKGWPILGTRTLVAKTCNKCGVLKDASAYASVAHRCGVYSDPSCTTCKNRRVMRATKTGQDETLEKVTKHRDPWTDDEYLYLRKSLEEGRTLKQIALDMGRTYNAIRNKVVRLDWWRLSND